MGASFETRLRRPQDEVRGTEFKTQPIASTALPCSVLPRGDKARGRAQHVALGAHAGRVDPGNRLVDQAVELAARAIETERSDQRALVLTRGLAGAFAER